MHAYRFRILTDEQDDFIRDIEVLASQTFLDFHAYLIRLLEFDSNELASFSICNSKWYKLCEITLIDMQMEEENRDEDEPESSKKLKTYLMADSRLRDFIEDPHQRLVYEYDFLHLKTFYLELTKILPAEPGLQYPRCILSEGVLAKTAAPPILAEGDETDLSIDDLDMGGLDMEFDTGIDESFLRSLGEGYEIEMDRSIEINMEESMGENMEEGRKAD